MGRGQTKEAAKGGRRGKSDTTRKEGTGKGREEKEDKKKEGLEMVKEKEKERKRNQFQGGQERRRGPRSSGAVLPYHTIQYIWSDSGPGQSLHSMTAGPYGTWQELYRHDVRKRCDP